MEVLVSKVFNNQKLEVYFSYSQSVTCVRKKFSIYKNGKRSNITTLRKLGIQVPEELTRNVYFFTPASSALLRRREEKKMRDLFVNFFSSNGFNIDYNEL